MKKLTAAQIEKMIFGSIEKNSGMFNFDYWKGFCNAFDIINNNLDGSTWAKLRPRAVERCKRFTASNSF